MLLRLIKPKDSRVLVGDSVGDDAVVVRLNDSTVLVQTVDFFTPVVDSPYHYGRIAAANSLSDVYAMGGQPVTAMNICCFPTRQLGGEVLAEILRGGLDTILEAGALLAGGHTVEDQEPKYGLAVTGVIDPDRMMTKGGARPGQRLVLSKPLGTGVLTTAHKREAASAAHLDAAVEWMERLNREAAEALVAAGTTGGTDITGYGLLGHLFEMARASQVTMRLEASRIPWLDGVFDYYRQGHFPGGSRANRAWLEGAGALGWEEGVDPEVRDLLNDAQTSGGLLGAIPPEHPTPAGFWEIGQVLEAEEVSLRVCP